MKKFLLTGLLGTAGLVAAEPNQAPARSAEADWQEIQALMKGQRTEFSTAFRGPPVVRQEVTQMLDRHARALREKLDAFFATYPNSPLRWKAVDEMRNMRPPSFVTRFGPDFQTKELDDAVIDETAKAAWAAQVDALVSQMVAAPDTPPGNRANGEFHLLLRDMRAADMAVKKNGTKMDVTEFRRQFDRFVAKYADLPYLGNRAKAYMGLLEKIAPDDAAGEWRHLANSPSVEIREVASAKVRRLEILAQPLVIAFTAVDGQVVDLEKLRGKVVLVDFWATWCGPCIAELPNLKRVYAEYHDKGFEVIGIALENGRLMLNDTPEQTATKLEAAKKILTDFTAKEAMPWPQYFDGKFWKNDFSTHYAIESIPAMFLIDQDGKLVSTNARGESLEREVKRLLKR